MTSKVSLISASFILLGQNPVSDVSTFNTGNPIHAAASTWYDLVVADFFSGPQPWRFAIYTQALSRLVTAPLMDDWQYAFQLPTDPAYKMLVQVYPSSSYMIYEDKIYSNQTSLMIDYVYQPAESTFPSYFQLAVIYKLTANIAMLITQEQTVAERWATNAILQEKKARFIDSKVNPNGILKYGVTYASHFGTVIG